MNTTAASATLPKKNLKGTKLNPEYIALWESYLDEGLSVKHVAEIFAVSKDTVNKYYPGRGWTHEQVTAHGIAVRQYNQKMRKRSLML